MTEEHQEEITEEVTPDPAPEKPKGYEPVDLEALNLSDEEKSAIQDRIDYLYKQVKTGQQTMSDFQDHNTRLDAAIRKQSERLSNLESESGERSLESIKAEIVEATDMGETERVIELTEQLVEMKTAAKQETLKEPEVLTAEQNSALAAWSQELDESGNMKRPWTAPSHPEFSKATQVAMSVAADPNFMALPTQAILAEVDRRMKPDATPKAAPVLSSGSGKKASKGDYKLSDEEKTVARRMGIDPKDYAAQAKLIKGI